jgi:D-alanyl-D-alanine endopeptidase (penicillin-binding protein 7)
LVPGATFNASSVTAKAFIAVDVPTRRILVAQNIDDAHPLASITKLMTATVALEKGTAFDSQQAVMAADEIGGARLRVPVGTTMTFRDLMYSMLVGSANNAAHAIARISDSNVESFVAKMNAKAEAFGLANTEFMDPSGLNVNNVSTAREVAALALEAFDQYEIRRICSTATYEFQTDDGPHTLKNTNDLLTETANGLTVLGGKTGYLIESEWNLAVKMMDSRQRPILVVVLGSDAQDQVFRDARTVADWVWGNYRW